MELILHPQYGDVKIIGSLTSLGRSRAAFSHPGTGTGRPLHLHESHAGTGSIQTENLRTRGEGTDPNPTEAGKLEKGPSRPSRGHIRELYHSGD